MFFCAIETRQHSGELAISLGITNTSMGAGRGPQIPSRRAARIVFGPGRTKRPRRLTRPWRLAPNTNGGSLIRYPSCRKRGPLENKARILIVDDDPLFRQMMARALTGAGYRCDAAEDGVEGLRLSSESRYDLILTDLSMPGLDGLQFIRRTRAGGRNATTPVLVVSADAEIENPCFFGDIEVQDVLAKPLDRDDLLERVAAVLEGANPMG